MNNNCSRGKMSFISFYSLNVKKNLANLLEKNSQPGAKITPVFRLSWKYFNHVIIKTF